MTKKEISFGLCVENLVLECSQIPFWNLILEEKRDRGKCARPRSALSISRGKTHQLKYPLVEDWFHKLRLTDIKNKGPV